MSILLWRLLPEHFIQFFTHKMNPIKQNIQNINYVCFLMAFLAYMSVTWLPGLFPITDTGKSSFGWAYNHTICEICRYTDALIHTPTNTHAYLHTHVYTHTSTTYFVLTLWPIQNLGLSLKVFEISPAERRIFLLSTLCWCRACALSCSWELCKSTDTVHFVQCVCVDIYIPKAVCISTDSTFYTVNEAVCTKTVQYIQSCEVVKTSTLHILYSIPLALSTLDAMRLSAHKQT